MFKIFGIIFAVLMFLLLKPVEAKVRNPFESPLKPEEEAEILGISLFDAEEILDLNLTGIVRSLDRAAAIIDGRIVRVGDEIGDKKIILIKKDTVVLAKDGKKHVIKMSEEK